MGERERLHSWLIKGSILCTLAISLAGVFLLTFEFDESWILTTIKKMVTGYGRDPEVRPVSTTGGVYALLQSGIFLVFGNWIPASRLLSVASLAILVWLIVRRVKRDTDSSVAGWIAAAIALATPGTLTFSSMAFGLIPATALFLLFVEFWEKSDSGLKRWLICGAILACTITTRVNFVAVLPALFLWNFFLNRRNEGFKDATAICAIAVPLAIAIGGIHLYFMSDIHSGASMLLHSTGFRYLDMGLLSKSFNRLMISNQLYPFFFMALGSAAAWIFYKRQLPGAKGAILICLSSWILWTLWIARAPYPFLRYIWPAFFGFQVLIGTAIAHSYAYCVKQRVQLAYVPVALALCALWGNHILGLRSVTLGDTSVILNEWAANTGIEPYRAYEAKAREEKIARYLKEQYPEKQSFGAFWNTMQLAYLTDHTLIPEWYWKQNKITPKMYIVRDFKALDQNTQDWLDRYCQLVADIHGYRIYDNPNDVRPE